MESPSSPSTARGQAGRASKLLRALYLLALALVALLAVNDALEAGAIAHDAVHESASALRSNRAPSSAYVFNNGGPSEAIALDAAEADARDDDIGGHLDRLSTFAWHAVALPDPRPLVSHRVSRAGPPRDPSQLATGCGFARGPPASIVRG